MPGHAASGLQPGQLGPGQKAPMDASEMMHQKAVPKRDGEIVTASPRMKQKRVPGPGGGRYTAAKRMKQGSK